MQEQHMASNNENTDVGSTQSCCEKLLGLVTRIGCILVAVLQSVLLNAYLVMYFNTRWYSWIVADVIVIGVLAWALAQSYIYIFYPHKRPRETDKYSGELPFGYIAWLFYVVILLAKAAIIFKHIANQLKESYVFGPNTLKASLALSSIMFLLLFNSHSNAPLNSDRKRIMNAWSTSVTFDIIDSVEFMEVLFVQESRVMLTFNLENIILSFGLISFILPVFPLLVLSHTPLGKKPYSIKVQIVHVLAFTFLVNVPFFGIRMYIWHVLISDISSFVVKNLIIIGIGLREAIQLFMELKAESKETESIEMEPLDVRPNRPKGDAVEMESKHGTGQGQQI
ncbi:uncharacterized protein LOC141901917 [Tubulanus polymorphus]|uniref:uncharacterized protein LOC141901917 n=1 Tax=Tubulanus polymorphus TaxID=672921 RepID=UPI003DA3F005